MEQTILLEKGTGKTAEVNKIGVPDLWHLAMWLKDNPPNIEHHHLGLQNILDGKPAGEADWAEAVLECWHLCHSLLDHIRQS